MKLLAFSILLIGTVSAAHLTAQVRGDWRNEPNQVPAVMEELYGEVSGPLQPFANLWKHWADQARTNGIIMKQIPKIIIVVDNDRMLEVTSDLEYPLYENDDRRSALEVIQNCVSFDDINRHDFHQKKSIVIKMASGNKIHLKYNDQNNQYTANGVKLKSIKLLPKRRVLIIVTDFMFNHKTLVQNGIRKGLAIPDLPSKVQQNLPSEFTQFWKDRISNRRLIESKHAPKTIIVPTNEALEGGRLQNYLQKKENRDLADSLLLDCMTLKFINFNDPRLESPAVIKVPMMSGKVVDFYKEGGDYYMNTAKVEEYKELSYGTIVVVVREFLFDYKFLPKKFSVPKMPQAFRQQMQRMNITYMHRLWNHFLVNYTQNPSKEPFTIIAVDDSLAQRLLTHTEGEETIYDEYNSYLASQCFRDSMSYQKIYIHDSEMNSQEGIVIKSVSGKNLRIKKEETGKYTVNGVRAKAVKELSNGRVVFTVKDFIFDHHEKLQKAHEVSCDLHPEENMPVMPLAYEQQANSLFSKMWKNWIGLYEKEVRFQVAVPRIIIEVVDDAWNKVMPNHTYNPMLDCDSSEIANRFINDSLSSDDIIIRERQMRSGVTVITMGGKELFMILDQSGNMKINNVEAARYKILSDFTFVVYMKSFLFNYEKEIRQLYNPIETSLVGIPQIPGDYETNSEQYKSHHLVQLWRTMLNKCTHCSELKPKAIIQVQSLKMKQLERIVYSDKEKVDILREILLDCLVHKYVNKYSQKLHTQHGLQVHSVSGKKLVIREDPHTKETKINGVKVIDYQHLSNGGLVITVEDFLFNHKEKLQKLSDYFVPEIPTDVNFNTKDVTPEMLNIWSRVNKNISKNGSLDVKVPRTVVMVQKTKFSQAIHGNLGYISHNIQMAYQFLIDSVCEDQVNLNDSRISTSSGLTVRSMSGKPWKFRHNAAGQLTLNGVRVEECKYLKNGTLLIIVDNFIFNQEYELQLGAQHSPKLHSGHQGQDLERLNQQYIHSEH